tara:strand:+ start:150 stop:569 length:420 start_codon:yes stop_codon:yes gene_type:complete
MAFTLKEVRTGQQHTFSAKEILELIGDRINDEIIIRDEVYSISSCVDFSLGGGDSTSSGVIDWITLELSMESNGETVFYNPEIINDTDSVFLTVNSILYQYGLNRDFHIEGDRLFWHGGFDLDTTDRVVLRYPKTTPTS